MDQKEKQLSEADAKPRLKRKLKKVHRSAVLNSSIVASRKIIKKAHNQSINTPLRMKTLQMNNRALARSLEDERNEVKLLQERYLGAITTIQDLETRLNSMSNINSTHQHGLDRIRGILIQVSKDLVGTVSLLEEAINECSQPGRKSSICVGLASARSSSASTGRDSTEVMPTRTIYGAYKPQNKELVDEPAASVVNTQVTLQGATNRVRKLEEDTRALMELSVVEEQSFFVDDVPIMFADEKNPNRRQPPASMQTVCEDEEGSPSTRRTSRVPRRVAVYKSVEGPQSEVPCVEPEKATDAEVQKIDQPEDAEVQKPDQPEDATESCSSGAEKANKDKKEEDPQEKNTKKPTSRSSRRNKSKTRSPEKVDQKVDRQNDKFENDPDFINTHKKINKEKKSKKISSRQQLTSDSESGENDVTTKSNTETTNGAVSDKELSSVSLSTSSKVVEDANSSEKVHKRITKKKDDARTDSSHTKQSSRKHAETDDESLSKVDTEERESRSRTRRKRAPVTYKEPESDEEFPSQTSKGNPLKEERIATSDSNNKISEKSANKQAERRRTRQRSKSRGRRAKSPESSDEHSDPPAEKIISSENVQDLKEPDKDKQKGQPAEHETSKVHLDTKRSSRSRSRSIARLTKTNETVTTVEMTLEQDNASGSKQKAQEEMGDAEDAFAEDDEEARKREEEMAFRPRHKLLHSDDESRAPPRTSADEPHMDSVKENVCPSEEASKEKEDKKRNSSIGIGRKRRKTRNKIYYSDDEDEEEEVKDKEETKKTEESTGDDMTEDSQKKQQKNELHGGLFVSMATPKAAHPVQHSDEDWIKNGKPVRPLATFIPVSPCKKPRLSKGSGESKVLKRVSSKTAIDASNKTQNKTCTGKEIALPDIEKETRRRTIEISITPVEESSEGNKSDNMPGKDGEAEVTNVEEIAEAAEELAMTTVPENYTETEAPEEQGFNSNVPINKVNSDDVTAKQEKSRNHERRGTFAIPPENMYKSKNTIKSGKDGSENATGSKDSKLKLRRGTFVTKPRKESEHSDDSSLSETGNSTGSEGVCKPSSTDLTKSHKQLKPRRETFLRPLPPKSAKLHKRKGTFTKEDDIGNLSDESPSILLASEDELEFEMDPELAKEVFEAEPPVQDSLKAPEIETTVCGNDSMELTEVIPSNICKAGSTTNLVNKENNTSSEGNALKVEDPKRSIESGMAVLQKRLSKIVQSRERQENSADSDDDIDATENFDKLIKNVKTAKLKNFTKSGHKSLQEKVNTLLEEKTRTDKEKQTMKPASKQVKPSAAPQNKNPGSGSKIPRKDHSSDSDRGSESSQDSHDEGEKTKSIKVLPKAGKHGKITFTAGRKQTPGNAMMSGGVKKTSQKSSLPTMSKVKDALKGKGKPKLGGKADEKGSGASSCAAAPAKTVFDISMNESVEVSASYDTFKKRVSAVAIGDLVKDTVPIQMPPPLPREHDETVITDSPHGIMVALGNGVRTKPRARTKSKQVSYAENLVETHLTTPAPKQDLSDSNRKECGHTPPKAPKVVEPSAKRRSSTSIPILSSHKTTTSETSRKKEAEENADLPQGKEKKTRDSLANNKEETTRTISVKDKEGQATRDNSSKDEGTETVTEQSLKHKKDKAARESMSGAEKGIEVSNEVEEKTQRDSSSKNTVDVPVIEAEKKESTSSKGKNKSSKKEAKSSRGSRDQKKSSKKSKEPQGGPKETESHPTTEQPEDEDFAPRRKRRAAASAISYKEPPTNSKLRRGDKGSSTIYEGVEKEKLEKDIYVRKSKSSGTAKKRRSSSTHHTHHSALSTITNIHHEVRIKQEPVSPEKDV